MKSVIRHLIPLLVVFLASCSSAQDENGSLETGETEVNETEVSSSVELDAQVAVDFMNSYIDNCNKMVDAVEMVKWVEASPLATSDFKHALKKMIEDAWKDDPEMGLGFDPLFDAQDYPDAGVTLKSFDAKTGRALLQGKNWDTYEVALLLVVENDKVLVDACGVVNLPKKLQAPR